MKDRKEIDQLFQEGFKEFEAAPPADMWERIDAKLRKKDDRKVIQLWWRWAGVAALSALLFTTGTLFMGPDSTEGDGVLVETESTTEPNTTKETQTEDAIKTPECQTIDEAIGDLEKDSPAESKTEDDLIDRSKK